jgi:ethanolamine utilization protein EutN
MILGRVIGEVWATRKHPAFEATKAMLVAVMQEGDGESEPSGEVIVAIDSIGARPGHTVTVSWGSGARATVESPENRHVLADAAICRIVDATSREQDGREEQVRKE